MDKKYINKAGFKSFFKNKIGAILLAFIVFLSAMTFTVLQTSVSNYSKSYNHIMTAGKLHDYTMKESYKANGDLKFEVVKDGTHPDIKKYIGENTIYTNQNYMVLAVDEQRKAGALKQFNKDILSNIQPDDWGQNYITSLLIDLNNIKIMDSNHDGAIDANDDISFKGDKIYGLVTSDRKHINPSNISSIMSSINSSKIYIDLKDGMKIKNSSNNQSYSLGQGSPEFSFDSNKMDSDQLKSEIIKNIVQINKLVPNTIHSVKANHYIIKPSAATTIDYRDEFIRRRNYYTSNVILINKNANIKGPIAKKIIEEKTSLMKANISKLKGDTFIKNMKADSISKFGGVHLLTKRINSINIYDSGNATKVVDSSQNNLMDKIILNSGSNIIKSTIGNEAAIRVKLKAKMDKYVADMTKKNGYPISATNLKYRLSEKWRYSLEFTFGFLPIVVSIIEPSSLSAVVSPTYASNHSLKPIDKSFFKSKEFLEAISNKDSEILKELFKKYKSNIVKIGTLSYFISGIGVSPDFSYPIISSRNPVVNTESQAIVFTNQSGFMRAKTSFNSAEEENYVGLKFKEDISWEKKQKIINYIEKQAHGVSGMNFPSNIRIISKFDDVSEKIIMAPQRVSFLQKLNKTIGTISWLTIIGLIALTALIVIVSIKRIISSEKKTLAIANANGYSKWTIAGSYIPAALLIVGLSALLGYVGGILLQPLFTNIFKNFWTIPLKKIGISLPSLLLTTIVPLVTIGLLVLVVVMVSMRGKVVDNLSDKESKTGQAFAYVVMKSIQWTGIKTKIAVSFIVTNIGKMALIMGATAIGVSVVTVAFTSMGKFSYAVDETNNVNRYEYAVDLVSPTEEGGMYSAVVPVDPSLPKYKTLYKGKPSRVWMGMQSDNTANPKYEGIPSNKFIYNQYDSSPKTTFAGWTSYSHSPGVWGSASYKSTPYGWGNKDTTGITSMNFLKGKVQSKALLNVEMGSTGQKANPWDINKQLMPKNQQNLADADYIKYITKIYNLALNKSSFDSELKINSIDSVEMTNHQNDKSENWYKTIGEIIEKTKNGQDVTNEKTTLLKELSITSGISKVVRPSYQQAIVNGYKAGIYPFSVAFDQITMNPTDETYTSIRGESMLLSRKEKSRLLNLSIKGVNEDSIYIHAGTKNISALKKFAGNNTPILINRYMEKFYGLSKGDTFEIEVKNRKDRYTNKVKHTTKLQVVGIMNSYSNNEVITLRTIANKVLNYDPIEGFNGVFSGEKKPMALTNVNLYSPSGLYPAFSTFDPKVSNEYKEILGNYLRNAGKNPKLSVSTIDDFVNTYSNNIYQSTITNVQWARMDDFTFKSINHLSSSLIVLVEVVALIIAIIFIIILGSIMLESNKRNISTLKVVGYRNGEIRNAFLKSLLPSLLFGMLIAIPIVFAVLIGMQFTIMGFGAILIPLTMLGWEFLASALIVSLIFIWIFSASIRSLKGQSALEAFKE
ncbi:MAG: ABC transporter permease [Mycoplasmataceae bacterium]|nr:ABC transporter permease [Mycoplasmataceae bacterium]